MRDIIMVIIRTFIVMITIFILFKMMGKKQVSQMNMFDYITGITIGSIVADISLDIEKNLLAGIICLLIYCLAQIVISYLSLKSIHLRELFNDKETILIKDGKIIRENLRRNRININILESEARLMGYFNLKDINNAMLEPNGKISFEVFDENKAATKKDLNISCQNNGIVYNIIIDGNIITENLSLAKITIDWLNHELKVMGIKKKDILLLTVDYNKHINYYLK